MLVITIIWCARSHLQHDRAARSVVICVPAFGRFEHQRSGRRAMRSVRPVFFQRAGQDQRKPRLAMPMPRLPHVWAIRAVRTCSVANELHGEAVDTAGG